MCQKLSSHHFSSFLSIKGDVCIVCCITSSFSSPPFPHILDVFVNALSLKSIRYYWFLIIIWPKIVCYTAPLEHPGIILFCQTIFVCWSMKYNLKTLVLVWNNMVSLKEFASFGVRFYRIVHAPIFLRYFASDRRHMKDSAGNWTAEPPKYEPIVAEGKMLGNVWKFVAISF